MKCEKCQQEHNGQYGSGRFCRGKCARAFSTAKSRKEINKKVSEKLYGRGGGREMITCPQCQNEFKDRIKRGRKFCSKACARKYNGNSIETREKLRSIMLEKIKNGTHSGWKSRKGKRPSYPEKFFMEVLNNNEIHYEHELPCGKYFIDLAIKDKMIALEIDGKQHQYADRKEKDLEKDKYLVDNGWKVYRIKWKSINNLDGKIYIREEIDRFLKFHRSFA